MEIILTKKNAINLVSEYAVVSTRINSKIDKTLKFEEAAGFGCPVIIGAGAVFNTKNLRLTKQQLCLGGTAMVHLGARAAGASKITLY